MRCFGQKLRRPDVCIVFFNVSIASIRVVILGPMHANTSIAHYHVLCRKAAAPGEDLAEVPVKDQHAHFVRLVCSLVHFSLCHCS